MFTLRCMDYVWCGVDHPLSLPACSGKTASGSRKYGESIQQSVNINSSYISKFSHIVLSSILFSC